MGKITIKHFLNTNLKPYVINKQNYYSIYLLITGQRKTTKVKSIVFNEYYSENDFETIFNSDNLEDNNLIENEINSIKIISEFVVNELKEFDTNFLTAYYNFSNTIDIWKTDNQIFSYNEDKIDLYDSTKNNAGIILDDLKNKFTDIRGVSLYEFFNKENQNKALQILKKQKVKNDVDVLADINLTFFYSSIEFFEWFIKGNKKNAELESKYQYFFETAKTRFDSYIVKKYKIL
ncbi:hypothetical protein [Epilithonimonas tenax]|uniref:hypothetical protein n=1 Tax=Epilithonimonas tenax TaxID=191577 RepID=UPI000484338C|nr:hypothetical protein [Epilithonimonas tenax]